MPSLPLMAFLSDSGRSLSAPATTVDLGEGGVQLVASAALAVGDVVKVFIGNGDLGVSQQGLVVGQQLHAGDQAAVNIAFRTPTEVDAARLRDLIDLR